MPWHLHKRKGRKYWEMVSGRKRRSTGVTRRALADKILENFILRGKGITVNSNEPIERAVHNYVKQCREFNKASTLDDKKRTLRFFLEFHGNVPLSSVNQRDIGQYLGHRVGARSKRPISAERWNSERQILANFFRWLQKRGELDHNPAAEVEKKKIVRSKIPRALTVAQEKTLLRWCKRHDQELYRMAVLVGNTGIRVRELANLQWHDVAGPSLTITAKEDWTPKDYEERAIPMSPLAKAVIVRQQRSRASRWVFPREDGERYGRGLDLRMVRAFKRAGLGSGGFHRLRHTFATRAIEAHMDIEVLRRVLGHADTKTLTKYSHVSPEHIKKQASLVKFGAI